MSNPVKNRRSKTLVMEDFDPVREREIRRNDRTGSFITSSQQLEHQFSRRQIKRDIPDQLFLLNFHSLRPEPRSPYQLPALPQSPRFVRES